MGVNFGEGGGWKSCFIYALHPISRKTKKRILLSILEQTNQQEESLSMKLKKSIALATCLVSITLLTGCPGGGSNNNNNNNNNPPPNGTAISDLNGVTITVRVTGGVAPFASGGSYTFVQTSGNGNSGNYELTGSGGPQSNIGSYTYSASGNTGTLTEVEQSGTLVNNTLTFTTSNSGTISSSSPPGSGPRDVGGSQTGTFTIN
jgi:hypothetical protein